MSDMAFANAFPDYSGEKPLKAQGKVRAMAGKLEYFFTRAFGLRAPPPPRWRNFFPINAPDMDRFKLLNLGVLGYGLELIFWVVIAIIVSLTLTITLITTLTII